MEQLDRLAKRVQRPAVPREHERYGLRRDLELPADFAKRVAQPPQRGDIANTAGQVVDCLAPDILPGNGGVLWVGVVVHALRIFALEEERRNRMPA